MVDRIIRTQMMLVSAAVPRRCLVRKRSWTLAERRCCCCCCRRCPWKEIGVDDDYDDVR